MTTSRSVTLLDYGMCNMLNVARAFERAGADLKVTEDPRDAAQAERLVVPGVGAFADSMVEVTRRGHGDAIRAFAETGRPLLGICVGMQILFEGSEEFGDSPGLGIIAGRVMAVPAHTNAGVPQRVPHIGWNELLIPPSRNTWDGTIMQSHVSKTPAVYFVHSFVPHPADPKDRLADFDYGGHRLCAAIKRDNITATQFHPERSGDVGLALLGSFIGS